MPDFAIALIIRPLFMLAIIVFIGLPIHMLSRRLKPGKLRDLLTMRVK